MYAKSFFSSCTRVRRPAWRKIPHGTGQGVAQATPLMLSKVNLVDMRLGHLSNGQHVSREVVRLMLSLNPGFTVHCSRSWYP